MRLEFTEMGMITGEVGVLEFVINYECSRFNFCECGVLLTALSLSLPFFYFPGTRTCCVFSVALVSLKGLPGSKVEMS